MHLGGTAIQSAMRLATPDMLELHYTRTMMAALLVNDAPRELLMIGLGGGSIVRSIGSINAVYFAIEIENATLRADPKERMASTTAGDVWFATELGIAMGAPPPSRSSEIEIMKRRIQNRRPDP
jgi:hypothetical protein